jgi:hypothetical protein
MDANLGSYMLQHACPLMHFRVPLLVVQATLPMVTRARGGPAAFEVCGSHVWPQADSCTFHTWAPGAKCHWWGPLPPCHATTSAACLVCKQYTYSICIQALAQAAETNTLTALSRHPSCLCAGQAISHLSTLPGPLPLGPA